MIAEHLSARLYLLGLHGVSRVVTHTNRSVMVSIGKRRVLRLHAGYAHASDAVLRAIIRFLDPRLPRAVRRAAERELLAFPVEMYAPAAPPEYRRERPRPGDLLLLHRLSQPSGESIAGSASRGRTNTAPTRTPACPSY